MKPTLSDQKLRGGYYTPPAIADFLAAWAVQTAGDRVLEPACGDGNLMEAAVAALRERGATPAQIAHNLRGVEFDPQEADKSRRRLNAQGVKDACIHTGDFFAYCRERLMGARLLGATLEEGSRFEAIIGNPPFIRYQNFPEEHREAAFGLMRQAGLHPNRLTNAWSPFLVASTLLLSARGRLAMVIPAELFQVSYAAEIRQFLSDFYHRITIVTFKKLVFDDIQQEIVLLLCERDTHGEAGIRVLELEDGAELTLWKNREPDTALKPLDHSKEKWTQYFLDPEEIELLRALRCHPKVVLSGKVLDVDVGVVTGDNGFFALTRQQAQEKGLTEFTSRMVTRSAHLEGGVFTEDDWQANALKQYPSYLLLPPDVGREALPTAVLRYVEEGEERGVNGGYKCRIRKRWYIVPSIATPDAFMLRQVHGYPKLILNAAGATSTDTIHRVRFREGANGRAMTAAFVNSLTLAFSEVTGRSYGGGVLTFEPSEAEALPMVVAGAEALDMDEIDRLLRTNDIEGVLDRTDAVLLRGTLGLSAREAQRVRGIWKKMRDRRIYRKR